MNSVAKKKNNNNNNNDNDKENRSIKRKSNDKLEISLSSKNNKTLKLYGIGFDKEELDYYSELFESLGRNPRLIELFDLCQSNSEHSRHWFFKGRYIIDGITSNVSLFKKVKDTLVKPHNSLVAFSDNSSVISGFKTKTAILDTNNFYNVESSSSICDKVRLESCSDNFSLGLLNETMNPVLTAETHNFPTLVCPFEGAATGVGGRIRDNQSTGRGAELIFSNAGYIVGDIEREQPITGTSYQIPSKMLIEASNGASDYGNKIGEPITGGFTRSIYYNTNDTIDTNDMCDTSVTSYENSLSKQTHYEYLNPIMSVSYTHLTLPTKA